MRWTSAIHGADLKLDRSDSMHFDDRLATILANAGDDDSACAAAWAQLVDLLSQPSVNLEVEQREAALRQLEFTRSKVPDRQRLAAAVSVAGRQLPMDLITLLCADKPSVAAPILSRLQLDAADWRSLLTVLPSTSRALVRLRRDLSADTIRALQSFGPSDLVLPAGNSRQVEDPPASEERGPSSPSISELVSRIEAWQFRNQRSQRTIARTTISRFMFETNASGEVIWVEGAAGAALVGLSIANATSANQIGVDGEAAGAFRKRDTIDGARLLLSGSKTLEGLWRLRATPFFDSETGRFCGYRGFALRAGSNPANDLGRLELLGQELKPDSVRQLVHELRTPLNAIRGFAEMIEGEFLGGVAVEHRAQASAIINESDRLLSVFEDLDIASQLTGGRFADGPAQHNDLIRTIKDAAVAKSRLASVRGAALQVVLPDVPIVMLQDGTTGRRLIDKLLTIALATASAGEKIRLSVVPKNKTVYLNITRPMKLHGISDDALFSATTNIDGETGQDLPLGLGFVFRLLSQLVRRSGHQFLIEHDRFTLILSGEATSARESREPR